MAIPSNFSSKLADIGIHYTNPNTSTSTGNEIANTFIGLGTSIGSLLLAGAISRNSAANGADGTQGAKDGQGAAQQTQLQQLETQLALEQAKQEAYEANLATLEKTIEDLTQKTDETLIKQKEESVNKLKNELYGKDAKHKELANQITQANDKCTSTSQTLSEATNTYSSLSRELSSMQGKRANIEALTHSDNEDEAKSASERLSSLDAEITQKQTEVNLAKTKMEEALKANQLAEDQRKALKAKDEQAFIEVQSKIEEYNNANAELTDMKNSKETNKKLLEQACTNKATLETELAAQKELVQNLEDKVLEEKGKNLRETNDAASDYNSADQKDGNWLSRTWQKTKGIFSKSERAEYKEMKAAHEAKNNAEDRLQSLGISDADGYIETKANQKAQNFCNKNPYYKNMTQMAAKFIADNLDATDADIKEYLDGVIKKANS